MKILREITYESLLDINPEDYEIKFPKVITKGFVKENGLDKIEKLIIPEGVKEIHPNAFYNSILKRIVFPSTIRFIDSNAFYGCTNLEEVVFDPKCKGVNIQISTFAYCTKLKSVHIPDGSRIADGAFSHCTNLSDLTFGEHVSLDGWKIFLECTGLQKIDMSRTRIEDSTIPPHTFAGCTNLKEVILHPTIKAIDSCAFVYCEKLMSIEAPGVKIIGGQAFHGCTLLKEVTFAKSICIGYELRGSFPGSTFRDCKSLKSIPSTITKGIHSNDFSGCTNLKELSFGGPILLIDRSAFDGCTNLKVINVEGENSEFIKKKLIPLVPTTTKIIYK